MFAHFLSALPYMVVFAAQKPQIRNAATRRRSSPLQPKEPSARRNIPSFPTRDSIISLPSPREAESHPPFRRARRWRRSPRIIATYLGYCREESSTKTNAHQKCGYHPLPSKRSQRGVQIRGTTKDKYCSKHSERGEGLQMQGATKKSRRRVLIRT